MNVLVIGGGGREHALTWKLSREATVARVLCAPGNPGIAGLAATAAVDPGDVEAVARLAERERIDLTVVGPELPLDRGVVDHFRSQGLRIFGPDRVAAQLECSKVFAKAFMARHGIPTARYRVCESAAAAHETIASGVLGLPIVVKADGLAAGKGVVVAPDAQTAHEAVSAAMERREFGEAGARVVLEECLAGPEVSFFAVCDGETAVPLGTAQDHKRLLDGDRGPNTGGMGAFAPSPLVDAPLQRRIMETIVEPVLRGMREEGHPYRGFLYAGLMLTCAGPKVIEFNVRLGDPEAQVLLPGLAGEIAPVLAAAADGALARQGTQAIARSPEAHVGVVLAAGAYPAGGAGGVPIAGLERAAALDGVLVFHAGTDAEGGAVRARGGRVLTVVGRGATFADAIGRAYAGVSAVHFEGMQFRRDIGATANQVTASGGSAS